jgi:Rieske 2Fe-2S protein
MALPRADKLNEPPIVGRFYLVPAILWSMNTSCLMEGADLLKELQTSRDSRWWPVWGRKHNDLEFFDFEFQHYHIDPRFLNKRQWQHFRFHPDRTALAVLQGKPLNHRALRDGPPRPQLRRMKCTLSEIAWQHPSHPNVNALNTKFAGQKCRTSRLGFICPHQRFPLGSTHEVDGVVTCPLHGLRIDAQTGECLGGREGDGKTRDAFPMGAT